MVENEMVLVRVNVTEEHIIHGRKRNCFNCPVAKAIGELLVGDVDVSVGVTGGTLTIDKRGEALFDLPDEAGEWITKFDTGDLGYKAQPISFSVLLPKKFLKGVKDE